MGGSCGGFNRVIFILYMSYFKLETLAYDTVFMIHVEDTIQGGHVKLFYGESGYTFSPQVINHILYHLTCLKPNKITRHVTVGIGSNDYPPDLMEFNPTFQPWICILPWPTAMH